jgi:hypothetical protein
MMVTVVGRDRFRAAGGMLGGRAGVPDGWSGRFWAAVIAAVALEGLLGAGGERLLSAGGGWQGFELAEGGGQLRCPWPVVLQS